MKQLLLLLFGLLVFGCNSVTKNEISKLNNSKTGAEDTSVSTSSAIKKLDLASVRFDSHNLNILKGSLGDIKIGMTITEAEKQFNGLIKKSEDAACFGFDGGGSAYLYHSGEKLLFALIPKLATDTVLFIVAADSTLKTSKGINPNSTVADLVKVYPGLMVQQDLMNGWEFFQDEVNGWDFVFVTDKETEIGEYPVLELPSKPKRLLAKANWIVIR